MWIDSEPGELLMTRYLFCFEPGNPDPEDRRVRAYLRANGLFAKRIMTETREGVSCEVQYFGQCYLGGHLGKLNEMRHQGIIAGAVANHLQAEPGPAALLTGMTPARLADIVWDAAGGVLARQAAGPAEHDPTMVVLDRDVLHDELQKALLVHPLAE